MDIARLDSELEKLERSNLLRRRRTHSLREITHITCDGHRCVNFGSNDYLNFSTDVQICNAVVDATTLHGWGSGASPLVTGRSSLHTELEDRLAEFKQQESAIVFPSGFAANVGTIAALVGKGDTIFSDERNHASIIDGCRLSKANTVLYRHCDVNQLSRSLEQSPTTGRRLIVTDSLFSMGGDIAPLRELCELAKMHGAMLMVDEAHATGVFGERGSGCAELLGCSHEINIHVGTLSKAFGSQGGFVAGSKTLIQWLFNRARTYVFSTASPPALCAAALQALKLIHEEPHRRIELLEAAHDLRQDLKEQGFRTGNSTSQIVPIILESPEVTMKWSARLHELGFVVPGIRPPSVPDGESMLRISLTHAHDRKILKRFVETLGRLKRELD